MGNLEAFWRTAPPSSCQIGSQPHAPAYENSAIIPLLLSIFLLLPHPTPAMGFSLRTSEDSLFDDKDYLVSVPLPVTSQPKTFGKRHRTLLATAGLVSLLFLASYLTIQHRASDGFGADLEPIPFAPEDAEVELPSNTTYPLASLYSGVRGPPTPLFRGSRLSPPLMHSRLTKYRQPVTR